MQFHHVHHANRDLFVERLAGATIEEDRLTRLRQACAFEFDPDLVLFGAVEDSGRHVDTIPGAICEAHDRFGAGLIDRTGNALIRIDLAQLRTQGLQVGPVAVHDGIDPVPESKSGPSKVGLEDLAHVHS